MTFSGADPVTSLVLPTATEEGVRSGRRKGRCLAGFPILRTTPRRRDGHRALRVLMLSW
jgi:hypothetical protein